MYVSLIILILTRFPPRIFPERAFQIIWNSPTQICKIRYKNDLNLASYGIQANPNETWRGNLISLFYDSQLGLWPSLTTNTVTNKTDEVNGGIPQKSDISKHLAKVESDLESLVPNTNFDGFAVIDFEKYLPWWSLMNDGIYKIYHDASIAYYRSENPSITNISLINAGARIDYEMAVKLFILNTIKRLRELRPRAKWGYYMYPFCAKIANSGYFCDGKLKILNERAHWLYQNSFALYPNCYLHPRDIPDTEMRALYILKRMNEAKRISDYVGDVDIPIFPYIRYHYVQEPFPNFLTPVDMENSIGQAIDAGSSGIILWGDYSDFGDCSLLVQYIKNTLGPIARNMLSYANSCSDCVCGGNGRCVKSLFLNQPVTDSESLLKSEQIYDKFWEIPYYYNKSLESFGNNICRCYAAFDGYACQCYAGWSGPQCQTES
ncbi:unnamed protein product [Gordionus sp. m RMFG-2023]